MADPGCTALCDFCVHYAFNGDEAGAYTGDGRCEHPVHPRASEPEDSCGDFLCRTCSTRTVVHVDERDA